jgi:pyruvate formate lyase activating enzyme
VCYRQALRVSGRWLEADEVMRVLLRDQQFWGAAGGVSLSGGEPLVQKAFVRTLAERCRDAAMHVAVETSANIASSDLFDVVPLLDWVFADLKHMDPARHFEGTGADNRLILDNVARLAAASWGGRLVIRVTVVPGFNDDEENIEATARFVAGLGLEEIHLLPFHRLGASKYEQLGLLYAFAGQPAPEPAKLQRLQSICQSHGLSCYVGHQTPF